MQYFKVFVLTTLLVLGFSFPSCSSLNCNCPDETFFNVEGLDVLLYQDANLGLPIAEGDTIGFNTAKYIHLEYLVDYHTKVTPQRDWSFSLINSAYACSCIESAVRSKTEKLVNFSITTLNNFDDEHLANSDITDLFEFEGNFYDDYFNGGFSNMPLSERITNMTDRTLDGEDMVLKLTKAPELNQAFKIKVVMELSDGEIHEKESDEIFITP